MSCFRFLSALDRDLIFQVRATIVAGMGLFSDSYDLFSIPIVMEMLGKIYYENDDVPCRVALPMLAIALLGTVIGQILFGILGDRRGKLLLYGIALVLMVFSSIGCGFSVCATKQCVLVSLGMFRFLLGIGIGGDYPLSATIMSQIANKTTRGSFIAAVFSMQGFGILATSLITMVVIGSFDRGTRKSSEKERLQQADLAWRIILMLGAIPAALTYYWRIMMPETARILAMVLNNDQQASNGQQDPFQRPTDQRPNDYPLLSKQFFRRHGRDLFACAASWMIVDIPFYGSTVFQSQIYHQFLKLRGENVYKEAFIIALYQAILAIIFTIPGYWFTVYFIDKIGRRKIQMTGFFLMGVVFLCLGIPYLYWSDHMNYGFMFMYGLTFFFANFGPNTTTFIVPAELFPARFRATCHGICGAAGKIGALIGAIGFQITLSSVHGRQIALVILGGVSFLGTIVTYFFTRETMNRPLSENDEDDVEEIELSLFGWFRNRSRHMNATLS